MRWYKHYADARRNPKIRHAERELGEAGYARAFKLVEIVAERGGMADTFVPEINTAESYTDLSWLAEEMGISLSDVRKTMEIFARFKFIDREAWKSEIVRIPQMTEYLDEWTGRRQRRSSRVAPKSHGTGSGEKQSDGDKPEK